MPHFFPSFIFTVPRHLIWRWVFLYDRTNHPKDGAMKKKKIELLKFNNAVELPLCSGHSSCRKAYLKRWQKPTLPDTFRQLVFLVYNFVRRAKATPRRYFLLLQPHRNATTAEYARGRSQKEARMGSEFALFLTDEEILIKWFAT